MELRCPKGHISTDPDYCSECGSKMSGATSTIAAVAVTAPEMPAAASADEPCPD